ncbi:MAG TPA: hypothetical protein VMW42_10875, partial [Desulfatiglandales bacterium]|nr:hypothetical protein [Desulfatiglandales bacterium]
ILSLIRLESNLMLLENYMPSKWPAETRFREVVLKVEDNVCKICGSALIIIEIQKNSYSSL